MPNASKTQFLHLTTQHNFPYNCLLFFNDTQLFPSYTMNVLSLSFIQNLNLKSHTSSLTKSAFLKLGVLRCHRQLFSSPPTANSVQEIVRMENSSYIRGRFHPHSLIRQGGIKSFSSHQLISSDWLSPVTLSSTECCISSYLQSLFSC